MAMGKASNAVRRAASTPSCMHVILVCLPCGLPASRVELLQGVLSTIVMALSVHSLLILRAVGCAELVKVLDV